MSKYLLSHDKSAIIDINVSEFKDNTIVFPSEIDGNKITSIKIPEMTLFKLNDLFKGFNVIIEDGIKAMGDKLFKESNIRSISIPPSIKAIPEDCFYDSTIEEVIFQGKSSLETIGKYAFANCKKLRSISLPPSIKTIDTKAFKKSGLTEISFPEGTKKITIKEFAFTECEFLQKVVFPETNVVLCPHVFYCCNALVSVDMSKASTNLIPTAAFLNCQSLETVMLPETEELNTICKSAFAYCGNLRSISLSPGVDIIEDRAFRNTGLTEITFPKVAHLMIGEQAFAECKSLLNITFPEMMVSFGNYAFCCCDSLESVEISNVNTNAISDGMFLDCSALENITLPETVRLIGERAFCGCKLLHSVGLEKTQVSQILTKAFRKCSCYSDSKFPVTLAKIGTQAFTDCNLDSLSISPLLLDEVDNQAFAGNPLNKGIDLNFLANCDTIGDGIFSGTGIKSVSIPSFFGNNVSAKYMFSGCELLEKAEIEEDAILYEGMFFGCTNLETVSLPDTIKEIPDFTFQKTRGLKHIDFPNSIDTIGHSAFNRSGLRHLDLTHLNSVVIFPGAFNHLNLDSVKLPLYSCDIFGSTFDNKVFDSINKDSPFIVIHGSVPTRVDF